VFAPGALTARSAPGSVRGGAVAAGVVLPRRVGTCGGGLGRRTGRRGGGHESGRGHEKRQCCHGAQLGHVHQKHFPVLGAAPLGRPGDQENAVFTLPSR
jgi:hypothetical protein